MFTIIKVVILD